VLGGWWSLLVRFVGRERELARLLAALGGDTRLILVTGDAGVGKTRLMAEATVGTGAGGWWRRCVKRWGSYCLNSPRTR
jgi:ATP/maltotriose-dependent transcriptional regulator MalT